MPKLPRKKKELSERKRPPLKNNNEGRPTKFNKEICDRICFLVATNPMGLKKLCESFPELPSVCVIQEWRYKFPHFALSFNEAKAVQVNLMVEHCEELSNEKLYYVDGEGNKRVDTGFTSAQKLIVEQRRWYAAKLAPKMYGESRTNTFDGIRENNIELKAEIMKLRAELDAKNKKDY